MSALHRAAVLGAPVGHSLSPALHRAGFAALGLTDWSYDRLECDGDRLPGLITDCGPEWLGFSVTMPGKAAAAAVATLRTARVEALGVANTLYREAGSWAAENTDVEGLIGALQAAGLTSVDRVLVLGGGHTARAVLAGVAEMGGTRVTLAGRRPTSTSRAAELGIRLGLVTREIDLSEAAVSGAATGADLVASTLPAGVPDRLAAALAGVPALLDAVYHPWPTPLAAAGGAHRITVTGLDMLLHQAFRQFELFTGHPAPAVAMRDGLRAASGTDLPLPL